MPMGGNGYLTHIFVAIDLHHRELGVQGAALCLRFRGLHLLLNHLLLKVGHHGLGLGTGVGILVAVVAYRPPAASRSTTPSTMQTSPGDTLRILFTLAYLFFRDDFSAQWSPPCIIVFLAKPEEKISDFCRSFPWQVIFTRQTHYRNYSMYIQYFQ